MTPVGGRLAVLLDQGAFVVTSEVVPPRAGSAAAVTNAARGLVGYVDAINVTDNPAASPRLSPLAGARFVHEAGGRERRHVRRCRGVVVDVDRVDVANQPSRRVGHRRGAPGPRRDDLARDDERALIEEHGQPTADGRHT